MAKKYKHPYHNSGRKTGIEEWIENFDNNILPTLTNKNEIKSFKKLRKDMVAADKLNKKEGNLAFGDYCILVREIKEAKYIIDEDGKKIKVTKKQKMKTINSMEDLMEKHVKSFFKGATYIRTYPKKKAKKK